MGWMVAAEGLGAAVVAGLPRCCSLPVSSARLVLAGPTVVASKTTRPRRKVNGSLPRKQKQRQPSVAEMQRAIGVVDDSFRPSPGGASSSSSSSPSPFTALLENESPAERKIREFAEWVVDRTEAQAQSGQRMLLLACLSILPVWLLLLLIASGVIKLPFYIPYWSDLIS